MEARLRRSPSIQKLRSVPLLKVGFTPNNTQDDGREENPPHTHPEFNHQTPNSTKGVALMTRWKKRRGRVDTLISGDELSGTAGEVASISSERSLASNRSAAPSIASTNATPKSSVVQQQQQPQPSIKGRKAPGHTRITKHWIMGEGTKQIIPIVHHSQRQNSSTSAIMRQQELERLFDKRELQDFRQIFAMFDTDGSGAIGVDELKGAIKRLTGLQPSDEEVSALIAEVDENGDNEINFDEFCHCMKRYEETPSLGAANDGKPGGGGNTLEDTARQCFEVFDRDANGLITEQEFTYIAMEVGGFSPELAEYVFHELDVNSNGWLDGSQFTAIVEDYLFPSSTTLQEAEETQQAGPI